MCRSALPPSQRKTSAGLTNQPFTHAMKGKQSSSQTHMYSLGPCIPGGSYRSKAGDCQEAFSLCAHSCHTAHPYHHRKRGKRSLHAVSHRNSEWHINWIPRVGSPPAVFSPSLSSSALSLCRWEETTLGLWSVIPSLINFPFDSGMCLHSLLCSIKNLSTSV